MAPGKYEIRLQADEIEEHIEIHITNIQTLPVIVSYRVTHSHSCDQQLGKRWRNRGQVRL